MGMVWNSDGFKNATIIFQIVMNKILGYMIGEAAEVYMDDIVMHAKIKKSIITS